MISLLASVAGGVKRIYMTNINFTNILKAIDKYKVQVFRKSSNYFVCVLTNNFLLFFNSPTRVLLVPQHYPFSQKRRTSKNMISLVSGPSISQVHN